MEIIKKEIIAESEDDDNSFDLLYTFKTDYLEINDPETAITHHLKAGRPCGHDYDCCGCWMLDVYTHTMKRININTFTVEVHKYKNL